MPASAKETVKVACPRCGYAQTEPRSAYSTVCKNCQQHFRLADVLRPVAKATGPSIEQRSVRCFECGTELLAPKIATSTMCKRCSAHADLSDYRITQTVSKNFRTHGWLVVEEQGYLLNTNALAAEAVIKGRVIGKLATQGALEIHSSANIKGQIAPGKLVIPHGNHFHWPDPIQTGGAEIVGELAADLVSSGTVTFKSTARFFGNLQTVHLVVEAGAVLVGDVKVGSGQSV